MPLVLPEYHMIDPLTDWIAAFVTHYAPFAPLLLLFLEESGLPLPIPGDMYVAFEGYQVAQGKISYWVAFVLLMVAVLLGSSVLYYLSSRWGNFILLRVGRYLHLNEERIKLVEKYFRKHGVWVIILGRHIPGLRIPITFFAGTSGVPYPIFIASTFISVVFWIGIYLSAGSRLGRHVRSMFHADPVYITLLALPFLIFLGSIVYARIQLEREKKQKKLPAQQ
ncbi:MAG TPA: DedA family protein [Candidatus Saccharimonadia bacterium]|nr:DedA family protein [Candidatus Saccharimonadia bacterium]